MSNDRILVVGAGPVGLAFCLNLIRGGLKPEQIKLIDCVGEWNNESRAFGLASRSLELLTTLGPGVIDAFLSATYTQAPSLKMFFMNQFMSRSFSVLNTPYPWLSLIPQSEQQRILREELEKCGVTVQIKTRLISMQRHEDTDAIEVQLQNLETREAEALTFDYIFGCDGARSSVRSLCGFEFLGKSLDHVILFADVWMKPMLPFEERLGEEVFGGIFQHEEGNYGFLTLRREEKRSLRRVLVRAPLPKDGSDFWRMNSSRLSASTSGSMESKEDRNKAILDQIREALVKRSKDDYSWEGEPLWTSRFRPQFRSASQLADGRCRVFVLGDAAHIHSPVGGQGVNLGYGDAFDLGWKVPWALQNIPTHENRIALLRSYHLERRPYHEAMLKYTEIFHSIALGPGLIRGDFKLTDKLQALQLYVSQLSDRGRRAAAGAMSQLWWQVTDSPFVRPDLDTHPIAATISEKFFLTMDCCSTPGLRIPHVDVTEVRPDGAGKQSPICSIMPKDALTIIVVEGEGKHLNDILNAISEVHQNLIHARTSQMIDSGSKSFAGINFALLLAADGATLPAGPLQVDVTPIKIFRAQGNLKAFTLGSKLPSIYVIRPDLLVGCRSSPAKPAQIVHYISLFYPSEDAVVS